PAPVLLHSALSSAPSLPPPVTRRPSPVTPLCLTNSPKSLGQLLRNDRAILLENALLDTSLPLALDIPDHLRAQDDPGSYIVQARAPVDEAFRKLLKDAGAAIVSYIPNNAFLVRASAAVAQELAGLPQVQTVLP